MPEVTLEQVQKGITDLGTAVEKSKETTTTEIKGVKDDVTAIKSDVQVVKDEQDKIKEDVKTIKAAAGRQGGKVDQKSFNDHIKDNVVENADSFKALAAGSMKSMSFRVETKAAEDMTGTSSIAGGGYPKEYAQDIITLPSRKTHLRDLFGVGPTNSSSLVYYRETTPEGGVASQAAEGDEKSKIQLKLSQQEAVVKTIAGYTVISRQMLNNLPAMWSFLQKRLPELYLREEDRQLMSGTGANGQLAGLLPAIAAAATDEDNQLSAIMEMIGEIEDTDEEVNALLFRPSNYWKLLDIATLNKPDVIVIDPATGRLTIGGIPAYKTTAVPANTAIAGDFNMGADILQLTNMNVAISWEDGDNFRRNMATVRVEAEVSFPIYRPGAFRKLDLSALTS